MNLKLKKWLYACCILIGITSRGFLYAQNPCTTTTTNCNYLSNGTFENMDGVDCNNLHATGGSIYCTNPNFTETDNTFHGCSWTAGGWTFSGTGQTADYFNACADNCWNPGVNSTDNFASNSIGSIAPHTGDAYAGIFVYTSATAFSQGNPNYKESLKQTLSNPLIAGKTYIVSMWVRLAHISKFAVSDFWMNEINFTSTPLADKDNWTFLSTCYTPTANVTQIEIGSNATTLTDVDPFGTSYGTNSGQLNTVSYYYIDDVTIKPFNVNAGADIVSLFPSCGTQISSTNGGYTCLPAGATIAYSWLPSTGLSASNVATPTASPGTTTEYTVTATVTYTNDAGLTSICSSTDAVIVNVVTPTINITPSFTCNFNGVSSFTATPLPLGSYTYSWTVKDATTGTVVAVAGTGTTGATPSFSLQNVTQPVNICVSITNIYGCISTPTCYYLPYCCPTGTNVIKYANTTYSTTTVLASATGTNAIVLSGTITVNSGGTLIIASKEVLMNPHTKIVLNGSGKISIASDYVHGCNYMWDGIYAHGSTSGVTINNSRVEDAKRVIVDSLGGASVTLLNSYLNKNNIGISFMATKTSASIVSVKNTLFTCSNIATVPGTVPNIPTAVNLTNAQTLGAFTTTFMLPPYDTQKSLCGIFAVNTSHTGKITNGINTNAITIGGTAGQENVFDKMQHGIFAYDSKTHFQNNVFQNFKSTIAPSSFNANTGIYIIGPIFGAGNGSYLSVGGSLAFKNTFRSNDFGIHANGKSGLLVTHNTFSVQTTGAYVTENNNGSLVSINFNNFYQNGIAVNFFNNTYLAGNIKNNNMNNTATAVGTYADNFAIRCTEAALATNPSSYPAFDIDNNNISGFYNGIYAVNTLSLIATDNEIHMREDNAYEHWQTGICVTGSNANKVINNIIDMPNLNIGSWAYWQSGIFMTLNQVPRVQCNSINNLFHSITFKQNNSTAATDGVKSNYMQNAQNGIWMHDNAVIGSQAGNTGANSSDNVWATTCNLYTYMQGGSNPGSNFFFTRSLGSGYDLPNAKAGKDVSSNYFYGNNSSAAATGTACIANTATPSNQKVAGNALASLMQGADDILTDFDNEQSNVLSMANAPTNAAADGTDNTTSLKAVNRRHLLYNMVLQNIDVQQDVALSGFMYSIKSNNTGLLLAVDSLIHNAEKKSSLVTVAQQANTAIVPNNLVEQSQQEFNFIYLEYLAQNKKLNPAQLSSMINIAQQCPSYYGVSVYQARTVLFDINKQMYRNACENVSPTVSSKRMAQTNDNIAQTTDVNVFPNPANNQVFVTADDYTYVNLKLYNIMGELVLDKSITNASGIDISNFASGVYTYKVYSNDTELKVGKLIITH